MLQYLLALLVGILAGTFTGITPGIHINLLVPVLLAFSFSSSLPEIFLIIFIISMSVTHTFLDFIPSIFLGAPDEDSALSVLPGHEFLLKGHAHSAILYTLYGSCLGILVTLIFIPIFIFILPLYTQYITSAMFLILITASVYLTAKQKNKTFAIIIFLLAGFLGIASLNLELKNSLLPLLTGLFGSSSLVTSIIKKQKIPRQEISTLKQTLPNKSEIKTTFISSCLSAPLCSFLPSLGSSQAAVIGSDIVGEKNQKSFLILLGSINTIVLSLSFITLYIIGKTRTGSAVFIKNLSSSLPSDFLAITIPTIIFSGIFAFFLTIIISKFFAKNIHKFNYKYLSLVILTFLAIIVLTFSGFLGLIVFTTATFLGLSCIMLNLRRTNLMGSLMLPTILFYILL